MLEYDVYYNLLNSAMVILYSNWPDDELHVKTFPISSILSGFGRISILLLGFRRTSPFILPLVNIVPLSDHITSIGHGGLAIIIQH